VNNVSSKAPGNGSPRPGGKDRAAEPGGHIAGLKQSAKSPLDQAREQVIKTNSMSLWFSRFASRTAQLVGHPYMFLFAVVVLVAWAISGPFFHFSDTWQLIINTGTTIVTFLVVFLIQNTQNRDAKALHLKLDELIRSHVPARNDMIDIEKLSDEELDELEKRYAAICEENRTRKARTQSVIQPPKNKSAAKHDSKHDATQDTSVAIPQKKPAA
jgi:low affinity Fe/Cu permease